MTNTEGLGKSLRKLRKWKQGRLYRCINESLLTLAKQSGTPTTASLRRLCKQYFGLLAEHSPNMTRQEAASVIYFVHKLGVFDSDLGFAQLQRAVSNRLCDLFLQKSIIEDAALQMRETVRSMEEILHLPDRLLHSRFLGLVLAESPSETNMSWHEQA